MLTLLTNNLPETGKRQHENACLLRIARREALRTAPTSEAICWHRKVG
jgi:hypothetical protein